MIEVKLREPIQFGSETISAMTLQKPKAKHLRGMNLTDMKMDDFLNLIGKLSGLTDSQVGEMALDDLYEVIEVVTPFLGGTQETGAIA